MCVCVCDCVLILGCTVCVYAKDKLRKQHGVMFNMAIKTLATACNSN